MLTVKIALPTNLRQHIWADTADILNVFTMSNNAPNVLEAFPSIYKNKFVLISIGIGNSKGELRDI